MRRLLAIFVLLGLIFLPAIAAVPAHAQVDPFEEVCDSRTSNSPVCQEEADNPVSGEDGVIIQAVEILSWVIGVASIIMVLLGGLKYVTSGGDSNATASAKNTILYAVIGIAVALIAQAIVIFVIRNI